MKCPTCNVGTQPVKCPNCGDIRCNNNVSGKIKGCAAKDGPFGKSGQGASYNTLCKSCKKAKYVRL